MQTKTRERISLMRGHILRFLELANSIEDDDWIYVIKYIQNDKDRLRRMNLCLELGNIYVTLFFLHETLSNLVESP